jgi:hypothetical protein
VAVLLTCVEISSSSEHYKIRASSWCEVKLRAFLRPAFDGRSSRENGARDPGSVAQRQTGGSGRQAK